MTLIFRIIFPFPQVPVRLCSPVLSPTTQTAASSACPALNSSRNISVKAPAWFVSSSRWLVNMPHLSSSWMRSTPSAARVVVAEVIVRCREQCWSFSTNWMVSNPHKTSRSSCAQTELIFWILPSFVPEELIERSNSRILERPLVFISSKFTLVR